MAECIYTNEVFVIPYSLSAYHPFWVNFVAKLGKITENILVHVDDILFASMSTYSDLRHNYYDNHDNQPVD